MKITKSKSKIELLKQALEVQEKRLELQKLEKKLKSDIDALLGEDTSISTGEVVAVRKVNKRLLNDIERIVEVTKIDLTEFKKESVSTSIKVMRA